MVRNMLAKDIDTVAAMYQELHVTSAYSKLRWNQRKALNFLQVCVANPDIFAVVTETKGRITGFMLAMVQEHWLADGAMASDLTLYVEPGKRGGIAAVRLIKAYKCWAESKKVVYTNLGVSTGIEIERTGALYEKMGFGCVGSNHRI